MVAPLQVGNRQMMTAPQELKRLRRFQILEHPDNGVWRTLQLTIDDQEFFCVLDRQMLSGLGQLIQKHVAGMKD